MIIANNHQHATMLCTARQMPVSNGIHTAIKPGALAIPHGKHPIDFGITKLGYLLCAPDCSGSQIFINCWPKMNPAIFQRLTRSPQFLVDIVHRRAAITGYITGGI